MSDRVEFKRDIGLFMAVMIGIGAMVAVLGLSESSRADLSRSIEELGTNLLTVEPGSGFGGGDGVLPEESVAKIGADSVTLGSGEEIPANTTIWGAGLRANPVAEQVNWVVSRGASQSGVEPPSG